MDLSKSITYDASCPRCGDKLSDTIQRLAQSKRLRCASCHSVVPVEEQLISGLKQNLDTLETSIRRKRGAKVLRPLKRFFRLARV